MKLITVTDLSAPELAPYSHLTEAQLRNRLHPDQGLFIAESLKVIRVAIAAGYAPVSFLSEAKFVESQVLPLAEGLADVPVYTAEREVLAQLTGYELSRGILCAMRRPVLPSVTEVCRGTKRVAVMDNVDTSTNPGAIFRAAAALGIEAVLLTPTCCDPLNRRACRVSMGTVFQLPWTYLESYRQLHDEGFKLAALALNERATTLDNPALAATERLAIVMGTEGNGLSDATLAQCDYVVRIPMQRGVDSLNVAAAASIAFYTLCR